MQPLAEHFQWRLLTSLMEGRLQNVAACNGGHLFCLAAVVKPSGGFFLVVQARHVVYKFAHCV